jgi:hypothetical protein
MVGSCQEGSAWCKTHPLQAGMVFSKENKCPDCREEENMRRLVVFNSVTLDGYFVDMKGDMSWAHNTDAEFNAFVQDNARGGTRAGHGDHGKRQHCFTARAGRGDR